MNRTQNSKEVSVAENANVERCCWWETPIKKFFTGERINRLLIYGLIAGISWGIVDFVLFGLNLDAYSIEPMVLMRYVMGMVGLAFLLLIFPQVRTGVELGQEDRRMSSWRKVLNAKDNFSLGAMLIAVGFGGGVCVSVLMRIAVVPLIGSR